LLPAEVAHAGDESRKECIGEVGTKEMESVKIRWRRRPIWGFAQIPSDRATKRPYIAIAFTIRILLDTDYDYDYE